MDQHARCLAGLPLQFNGTNGVWRRRALDEVNGWRNDILAEDADASFRVFLKGWRIVHRPDYAVPTEIPEDMPAFRAQQRRWALGSAQILRTLAPDIFKARISVSAKLAMLVHLGRHAIDPLILLVCLFTPLTTLADFPFLIDYGTVANGVLSLAVLVGVMSFYGLALRKVGQPARELALAPFVIPLAVGLALTYTVAFFSGLSQKGGEFVRTPKYGTGSYLPASERAGSGPRYSSPRARLAWIEVGVGAGHVGFALSAVSHAYYLYGALFGVVAIGFLWVGVGSIQGNLSVTD